MKRLVILLLVSLLGVSAQDSLSTISDSISVNTPTEKVVNIQEESSKSGLHISGIPTEMNVKIDGIERGKTPLTITDLNDGEHNVVLTKKGYYGKKISVTTKKDSLIKVEAELRQPGTITISSNPEGALIFMNKKKIDKTPFTVTPVRPGSYSIMLLRGGYAQFDTTIEVSSGANDTLFAQMISTTPTTAPVTPDTTKPAVTSTLPANQDDTASAPLNEKQEEKKRKKIFKIIGSAIVATFLTVIMISELSGDEN